MRRFAVKTASATALQLPTALANAQILFLAYALAAKTIAVMIAWENAAILAHNTAHVLQQDTNSAVAIATGDSSKKPRLALQKHPCMLDCSAPLTVLIPNPIFCK